MAAQVAQSSRTVLHIHGGLVNKAAGVAAAHRLGAHYDAASVLSVFPVWESGLLETVRNNAKEIFDEKLFQVLLKSLIKHVGGKLTDIAAGRGGPYQKLTDLDARSAIEQARKAAASDTEPLKTLPVTTPPELTKQEEQAFADELKNSSDLQDAVDSIMLGIGVPPPPGGRAGAAAVTPTQRTMLSEQVIKELRSTQQPGGRGLFDPIAVIKHAVVILARVIARFAKKHDHGPYTTIVEELFRELYVGAIGTWVWQRMKKDTADTFVVDDGPARGGALFMQELAVQVRARVQSQQSLPQVSIVAHSAGAIWACHFLDQLRLRIGSGEFPAQFSLDRLIFMAPAVTCTEFARTLEHHAAKSLFREFRMFSLGDALEAGYWEAPPLYPRSLLYLISGVLETAADTPLVGMARYFDNRDDVYRSSEVVAVRRFLTDSRRSVWSRATGGDGLNSDALKHGAFDDDDPSNAIGSTMASAMYLLTH